MAKFKYLATDIHGKRIRGVQDAGSVRGAMALLVDQQLDVQQLDREEERPAVRRSRREKSSRPT